MRQGKGFWLTIKEKNGKEFRAKGRDVKRVHIFKRMRAAAAKNKEKSK